MIRRVKHCGSLLLSNFGLFGVWLLLIIPYDSKDFDLWPEKIEWWNTLFVTITI